MSETQKITWLFFYEYFCRIHTLITFRIFFIMFSSSIIASPTLESGFIIHKSVMVSEILNPIAIPSGVYMTVLDRDDMPSLETAWLERPTIDADMACINGGSISWSFITLAISSPSVDEITIPLIPSIEEFIFARTPLSSSISVYGIEIKL